MQNYQKEIDLINKLLALASSNRTKEQQVVYEKGYLTGLLASIANSDALVKRDLLERINHLSRS